jgi:tetratricopeptide (TPR) repeat protein
MKFSNPFKKKKVVQMAEVAQDPQSMPEPHDNQGYRRRGWAYHARGMNDLAEADFRRALSIDSDDVDANYVLGLVLKAQGRKEEAIPSFQKAVSLIEAGKLENKDRSEMLRRLALGHINELTVGDWNLEKEIWQRIE